MVQVGDVIRLRGSVFESELSKSEWQSKYLYEDTFKYVALRFSALNQPGDMAKTFFGSSESIVEDIECVYEGQPLIVLTNLFRIVYPAALEDREISVIPPMEKMFRTNEAESQLIKNLEFCEAKYLEGIFSIMERENNKFAMYKTGFYMIKNEGKWEGKY